MTFATTTTVRLSFSRTTKSEVHEPAMKDAILIAVQITPEERERFKRLARSKGMLMQGYLAQLVRRELAESEGVKRENIAFPYSDSIRNGTPAIGNQVR